MDALVPGSTAKADCRGQGYSGRDRRAKRRLSRCSRGIGTSTPSRFAKPSTTWTRTQIKPYFELNNVLENGVFYAATQLYGITFKERTDIPVYQPDVRVFEVFDADGKPLALWYCDYFKRDNKNGGAWMDVFVNQSKLLGTLPVVFNVANFSKPAPGQPALISFSDVTTMFHEFGHGLHGMFANTMYPSLSGTQVPRDFVEFPSQFNEHWASYPAVFRSLREALQDRRAHARRAGGQDRRSRRHSTRATS